MTDTLQPLRISPEDKKQVRLLYMAKHAKWGGGMHLEDGNHAIYHHEVPPDARRARAQPHAGGQL